jgi:hypothetical protein
VLTPGNHASENAGISSVIDNTGVVSGWLDRHGAAFVRPTATVYGAALRGRARWASRSLRAAHLHGGPRMTISSGSQVFKSPAHHVHHHVVPDFYAAWLRSKGFDAGGLPIPSGLRTLRLTL